MNVSWLAELGSTFLAFLLSPEITPLFLFGESHKSLPVTTRQSLATGQQTVFKSHLHEKYEVSFILKQ